VRRLLITLIVLALVAAGADYGLRLWGGLWVGDRAQEALHLSKRPDVSFGGVLVIPQVIRGRLESATLEEDGFLLRGVPFSHARLTLDEVRFQSSKLLLHHRGLIRAAHGEGELVMTAKDLETAFRAHGVDVSIAVSAGEVHASGGSLPQEITVSPSVADGSLVLRSAQGAPVALRLPLPSLGSGITYGSVAVQGNQAELSLKVRRARFTGLVG
jgi:hypothetical protein